VGDLEHVGEVVGVDLRAVLEARPSPRALPALAASRGCRGECAFRVARSTPGTRREAIAAVDAAPASVRLPGGRPVRGRVLLPCPSLKVSSVIGAIDSTTRPGPYLLARRPKRSPPGTRAGRLEITTAAGRMTSYIFAGRAAVASSSRERRAGSYDPHRALRQPPPRRAAVLRNCHVGPPLLPRSRSSRKAASNRLSAEYARAGARAVPAGGACRDCPPARDQVRHDPVMGIAGGR
jgi:hypothetical protein